MRWFKHDSSAHVDAKLEKVLMKYGFQGYGLYWHCVELVAGKVSKENITFELEHDAEILAHKGQMDSAKVQEVMAYMINLGLFECESHVVTCMKLAYRLDDTNAKNPEIRSIIARISRRNSESLRNTPSESDQIRLDKIRLDKNKTKGHSPSFIPPSIEEVSAYCTERSNGVDPESFVDHYEANGWLRGKNKIKDWKACVRTWEKSRQQETTGEVIY